MRLSRTTTRMELSARRRAPQTLRPRRFTTPMLSSNDDGCLGYRLVSPELAHPRGSSQGEWTRTYGGDSGLAYTGDRRGWVSLISGDGDIQSYYGYARCWLDVYNDAQRTVLTPAVRPVFVELWDVPMSPRL